MRAARCCDFGTLQHGPCRRPVSVARRRPHTDPPGLSMRHALALGVNGKSHQVCGAPKTHVLAI
eukprot:365253-Chlamydomonas_euryale.AAC.29